jgi:hypothetical protein
VICGGCDRDSSYLANRRVRIYLSISHSAGVELSQRSPNEVGRIQLLAGI